MGQSTLCLMVCDSLKAEIDAIAAAGAYPDVSFATFPARCGRPPLAWEEILAASPSDCGAVHAIGGCCLARVGLPTGHSRQCSTTSLDNCFSLLAGGYAVGRHVQQGAYLVTPGWLNEWRRHLDNSGFDREGARQFFAECCSEILLLDTGVRTGCETQLQEFSRYVARGFRVIPAGLDLMISKVERSVEAWRGRRESKLVSEYALALDLLGSLTKMVDEDEVVRQILTFYRIVFGATDLAYVVMDGGTPARIIRGERCCLAVDPELLEQAGALCSDHQLLESESGFLLAVKHEGEVIGVIRCAGIPLSRYRDQYLNLALSTAGIWGLALNNARSFRRIREISRQVEGQGRILEGINTIFREALTSGTDEDLGRICLSVAEEITRSKFGFIGEIGPDGLLHDTAISDPGWELCAIHEGPGRRPPGNFKVHGLYGSVLRLGRSLLTNEPAQHPESIGIPPGHPPLSAFLGVPMVEEGRVVGMIALGNREGGYGPEDLEAVEALAPAIVVAFRRKRAEEALQQANELLEERVAQRTRELADREARRSEAERALHQETVERLRVSEALRERERMLIQQSRLAALGEMINNIAHQWRQPLNAVGLVVQELHLIHEMGDLEKDYLDARVAKVMDLLWHMSQTIDDFRHFFKPDKEKVAFLVGDVVARTLSLVEESFRGQGIEVEVEGAGNPMITGYPNEYAQVLLNILINAKDAFAGRQGDEPRVVRIGFGEKERRSVLTIADNAGGIPEAILEKIFDPYFTTKSPDKGTGVGLYMAKMIIAKNMDGTLDVRNVGDGAEFRIEV